MHLLCIALLFDFVGFYFTLSSQGYRYDVGWYDIRCIASLGRLPKVDLIILERGKNVRPSVRPSTKSFFDLNEIWCIGRGR